jgi:hypothetical protein
VYVAVGIAKEGEIHPALADRFFGIVMVAAADERPVLLAPVGCLADTMNNTSMPQRFRGCGLVGVLATAYPKVEVQCAWDRGPPARARNAPTAARPDRQRRRWHR